MKRLGLVFSLLCVVAICGAQDNFPDIPNQDHVAFLAMLRLYMKGLISYEPRHGASSGPPPTEKQEAICLIDGIDGLAKKFELELTAPRKPSPCKSTLEALRSEISLFGGSWQSDFRKALAVLHSPIKALGRNPNVLERTLDEDQKIADRIVARLESEAIKMGGAPPFKDVPKSHWAYQAVQELRDAGILSGYPDKGYGG